MTTELLETWPVFVDDLSKILPLYLAHECRFDFAGVHGRMHACRAVLFAEYMCRYHWLHTSVRPAWADVRYAVAFHDAGREANGPDLWESSSAELCRAYLVRNPGKASLPSAAASLILHNANAVRSSEAAIVHDADVLEIMRPICGRSGRSGFRDQELLFLKEDGIDFIGAVTRNRLIEEAWRFIVVSESRKRELRGSLNYMADVLGILTDIRARCGMLAECLLS